MGFHSRSFSEVLFKNDDLSRLGKFVGDHRLKFTHVGIEFFFFYVKFEVNQVKIGVRHITHLSLRETTNGKKYGVLFELIKVKL